MDNQPAQTPGSASGTRRLGMMIAVIVVLTVVAFGVFYMLRSGTVGTGEMPAVEEAEVVEPVDEAAVEEVVVEGVAVEEAAGGIAVEEHVVSMKDFKFAPANITINAWESVTWKNDETDVSHRIALDDGSYMSAVVFAGEEEVRQFRMPGTYAYHCSIHPSMKGTVVVR